MKIAIIVSRVLLDISGVALLLLGILFWTGHALVLVRCTCCWARFWS